MSTGDTVSDQDELQNLDIAIIGMAGRFPGAPDLQAFWRNLRDGVESVTFFSDDELRARGVDPALLADPTFVKAEPVLDNIDQFSAAFFGYSPKEAALLDPQQRFFLECAWEALEHAGYSQDRSSATVGVYAGMSLSAYLLFNLLSTPALLASDDSLRVLIGNDKGFLSTRVGYHLNLRGPCIDVSTGCSTSLVAVHLACESLLSYQCDIALAGGISINIPQRTGYRYQEGGVASPDGHCRAFDASAQGSIFGSGVGIVVLKRLQEALDDGDTIHAVIRGSAVNNDGSYRIGYTAPSVDGQAEVLARAYAVARISPDTIGYVEAHGSGTALGDPIEVAALTKAFRAHTDQQQFCALGSVKTNIGHLDAAAGIAGLIKTVLALKHRQIPPSLHFEQPNPKIDFASSPFYVSTGLTPWPAADNPRRAGVSSFGVGGTNVHVVLEEAPSVAPATETRPQQVLLLSAKTASALDTAATNLARYLQADAAPHLADVAYTLALGRTALPYRRVLVAKDRSEAIAALEAQPGHAATTVLHDQRTRAVVFMFPGLGDHYENMAWGLYQSEPLFRSCVDRCSALLMRHLGSDLRDALYPQRGQTSAHPEATPAAGAATLDLRAMLRSRQDQDPATQRLSQTPLAHCALFVVEYALAQLWISWGVEPQALVGYSLGEYVAACLAEVMSLEDALMLVSQRARLIDALPPSAMLAVTLDAQVLASQLGPDLSIAAINSAKLCVVAGTLEAIGQLEQSLARQGIVCRRVQNSRALHSPQMQAITGQLTRMIGQIKLQPPRVRFLSNVTGTWISDAAATDPRYWVDHLCQTVQFAAALEHLVRDPDWLLLEVGPGQALSSLALQQETRSSAQIVLPSLGYRYDRRNDRDLLLTTLGALWQVGVPIDWASFYRHEQRQRVPLPTYPFERERYWITPQRPAEAIAESPTAPSAKPELERWFYQPSWSRAALTSATNTVTTGCCLMFCDTWGLAPAIARRLERMGWSVITVVAGARFQQIEPHSFMLQPDTLEHYADLMAALDVQKQVPTLVVHAWNITGGAPTSTSHSVEPTLDLSFYSLLYLAQTLLREDSAAQVKLVVLSDGIHNIAETEQLCPEKATVLGLCSVIPQEYQQVVCQSIDVLIPDKGSWQEQRLLDQLLAELLTPQSTPVVAYRGAQRWEPSFEPLRLDDLPLPQTRLRHHGVYLITGGLGGIGLELARYLAQVCQAQLVLTSRTPFPEQASWSQWIEQHDQTDRTSQTIQQIQAIQALGSEVLILRADVTSIEQMQAALMQARARFGALHGVIHAAGVAGGGLVRLKTRDLADQVLAPKVRGTLVLNALLHDAPLDWMILCSSMSALFGGVGQVDYSAANAFLDAFAHAASRANQPVTSINWYAWRDVGMEVNIELPPLLQQLRQENLQHAITPTEGVQAFHRIMGAALPQVIISTQPVATLREQSRTFTLAHSLANLPTLGADQTLHPRPLLRTSYVPPSNDLEQRLIAIWQDVLGIAEVGINDNFFDLGGNSLTGLQLIAQIKQQMDIELAAVNLFEGPTVSALARVITQQSGDNPAHEKSRRRGELRRERRQQPR